MGNGLNAVFLACPSTGGWVEQASSLFPRLAVRGGGGSRGFQPSESGLLLCLLLVVAVVVRKSKRTVAGKVDVPETAKDVILNPEH